MAELFKLADKKGSTFIHGRQSPASYTQNMPARVLHNWIRSGYLYEYKKKKK